MRGKDAAGNVDATPASVTWTIASGGAAPVLLAGNTAVESQSDPLQITQTEAWPFAAVANGTAATLAVYLDPNNSAGDVQVGMYSNSAGVPGTLLASGTMTAPAGGGWATAALSGSVSVTSGTTYWLSVLSSESGLVVRDRSNGTCTAHASVSPLGTFPGTWLVDNYTGPECPPSMALRTG